MKKRRHSPEQIIRKLAEGDKLLAEGKTVEEVSRHLEITESTWRLWVPRVSSGCLEQDFPGMAQPDETAFPLDQILVPSKQGLGLHEHPDDSGLAVDPARRARRDPRDAEPAGRPAGEIAKTCG